MPELIVGPKVKYEPNLILYRKIHAIKQYHSSQWNIEIELFGITFKPGVYFKVYSIGSMQINLYLSIRLMR